MSEKERLIFMLSSLEMSGKKIIEIVEKLGQNATIDNFLECDVEQFKLSSHEQKLLEAFSEEKLDKTLSKMYEKGIEFITYDSAEFPERLKYIDEAVAIIYFIGDINLLKTPCVAIVGSRDTDSYGQIVTTRFAKELARAGVTIVSGLALGVDGIAHTGALEVGGKTIAVLAGGLFSIYPAAHLDLARQIAKYGLLLSEYHPSFKQTPYTFPMRNRIVANISQGVLITQATLKSGTRYTKNYADDSLIPVFAVPGNINNIRSELTNSIIANGEGICVLNAEMILSRLDIAVKSAEKVEESLALSENEQKIVDCLASGELEYDKLAQKVGLNAQNLNTNLTTLEINGIIKRLAGNRIALC